MPGHVFVTGASGFVGSAVVQELLHRGYAVTALVHHKSFERHQPRLHPVVGDLLDSQVLEQSLHGCDAIIHLVGIIREHPHQGITFRRIHVEGTQSIVNAAVRAGITRFIHMSALGSRPDAISEYHRTKFLAEQYLRSGNLEWTIFQPSMIHGPHGEFMKMESRWVKKKAPPWLFMPYFGAGFTGFKGAGKIQPVYVNDMARAMVDAIEMPHKTTGQIYPIAGPEQFTWPQFHDLCAQAIVGHKRLKFPIPAWKAKLLTHLFPQSLLGFNRDQVLMSQENNTCPMGKFIETFGWSPQPFESVLRSYMKEL
jgi:nucleoside-diphosphate-sugar epimerase